MSDAYNTAYRKVPCTHEKNDNGCLDVVQPLVPRTEPWYRQCDGFVYEPWTEVAAEARMLQENWNQEIDACAKAEGGRDEALAAVGNLEVLLDHVREDSATHLAMCDRANTELTHYRSIGTPEQIEAVVEAATEVEKSEGAKPMTLPDTGAWRRYQNLRTALTKLSSSDDDDSLKGSE